MLKLNKKEGSICNAIRKLGLKKQEHKPWTDEENIFLQPAQPVKENLVVEESNEQINIDFYDILNILV